MWPENTETAFRGAAGIGYRFFETDVRLTADGVLVCFHDATLERTTNGFGPVVESTLAELRKLDAGYRHCIEGEYPFRGGGLVVPTFQEMTRAFPECGWVVDLKGEGTPEALADAIEKFNLHDRLLVGSFSTERLRRFRILTSGRVPTSTGSGETIRALLAAKMGWPIATFEETTAALQVPETWYGIPVVTSSTVDFAHSRDRLVHVWTVNHPSDMARLSKLGVDGIITDRPDLLNLR